MKMFLMCQYWSVREINSTSTFYLCSIANDSRTNGLLANGERRVRAIQEYGAL